MRLLRIGVDGVAEANVYLQWDADVFKTGYESDALTVVLVLDTNLLDMNGLFIEDQTVRNHLYAAKVPDDSSERFGGWIAKAQQVEIACRAVRFMGPQRKEPRALEDEKLRMFRLAQAIEEAFRGEGRKK